jgi:hypothetical protein
LDPTLKKKEKQKKKARAWLVLGLMPNQLNLIWAKGMFGKTNHYVNPFCFDIWPNKHLFILENSNGDFLKLFFYIKE